VAITAAVTSGRPEVGGNELGPQPPPHLLAPVGLGLGYPDPADVGVAGGDLAADKPDAAGPDDGQADGLGRWPWAHGT
jgi:hypothetical protein